MQMHLQVQSLRPQHQVPPVALRFDATPSEPVEPVQVVPVPVAPAVETRASQPGELPRVKCRSFFVAGAELDLQRVLFGILPWMTAERCGVDNLSKGGVAFECRFALAVGESVNLSLRVPGQREPIELKGEVRWCKRARYGGYRAGVRFAPFGESSGLNPRSALQALRAIEKAH
jgi:hypothetical protein